MAVTQKVTLYNNKFTVPPVINAVQNDTDRQVEAYFGDFTLQVGMTGKLSFIRSDGTHYEVSATLSTANNTATAELDQALTQAGVTQAQLKITDSGNVGSTFTFMIKVQPDVAGISVPQDGWSAQEFDQRLTDAENAIDAVEEDVADLQDKEYDYAPVITDTASGAIASFPDGADGVPVKDLQVHIEPVQSGSGDPSPDNVRPITGFSTAKVTRTGKNMLSVNSISLNRDTARTSAQGINTIPPGTYIITWTYSGTSQNTSLILRKASGIETDQKLFSITSGTYATFTLAEPYTAIYAFIGTNQASGTTAEISNIMIRPASDTDTTYEPYKGRQVVTISLGDTCYGGVLDVTTGKLRVTHKEITMDGSTSGKKVTNIGSRSGTEPYNFYQPLTDGSLYGMTSAGWVNNETMLAYGTMYSHGKVTTTTSVPYHLNVYIGGGGTVCQPRFFFPYDGEVTTVEQCNTWLASQYSNGTPVQIVYPLKDAVEVDLTATELKTILGTNCIFSDTNGNVSITYGADTALYIQKLISALA